MAEYFERQLKRNCTIHAINNAMQSQLVTVAMMDEEIERRVANKAPKVASLIRSQYKGVGGFYSPGIAYALLSRNNNYIAKPVNKYTSTGRYIVSGVKRDSYDHAIALYNGWLLDSEEEHPIKLPARDYFKRFAITSIVQLLPKSSVRAFQTGRHIIELA